jgi:ornithine--oxo-acid transaminase
MRLRDAKRRGDGIWSAMMLNRTISIVGAASGRGARERGCEAGPEALRRSDLATRLWRGGLDPIWEATIAAEPIEDDIAAVRNLCAPLSQRVRTIIERGAFPLVLGGDHSCAIGTWSGLAAALRPRGTLGLIWIDAHMDAHTPTTTPSGALHGMPLACLLGHGEPSLVALMDGHPLAPEHVCVVGVRSFEPGEAELLTRLGVRVFPMDEIDQRGLGEVMAEARAIVSKGTAGFGVTIDLDVIDPAEAPGVGSPVPWGLECAALAHALAAVSSDPQLVAAEIAEYNPSADNEGRTATVTAELAIALLGAGKVREDRRGVHELEWRYGAHNYDPLPVTLARGEGVHLWDEHGRRYLDMMSAYSAVSHGHCHPRLTRVLAQQAGTLNVTSRAYRNDRLPVLFERLCEVTGQEAVLPANTGLEAVEVALKAARKWGNKVKGIPQDEVEIIACEGNFHGRSIAIVAMSSEAQYRDGFGPFPPGFKRIPFGDTQALEHAITPNTAAFLVEPIQGEGGIIVPPAGYLARCAEICRNHDVLLICDEVQTGLGRTGRMLASEHEGVRPDGLILGKALGGGLLPVSAFLARRDVMDVFRPGDHGSTFGGNALAAAVALAAIDVLLEDRLPERAAELGDYFMRQLRTLESPLIREVRGKGLLIGVEFEAGPVSARLVCEKLLERGILTKDTHHTVVRFAPPLIITRAHIDETVAALRHVLAELGGSDSVDGPGELQELTFA